MSLLDRLKNALGARPSPGAVVDHPTLGSLAYDAELEAWRTSVATPAGSLAFVLHGNGKPDAAALEKAAVIVHSAPAFLAKLTAFLEAEAQAHKAVADEIRHLRIDDVVLYPSHGTGRVAGMIYFAGPHPDRLWRCDFDGHKPYDLGFDS
jgi:hypothetical protein